MARANQAFLFSWFFKLMTNVECVHDIGNSANGDLFEGWIKFQEDPLCCLVAHNQAACRSSCLTCVCDKVPFG